MTDFSETEVRLMAERDEAVRLLANATDPENAADWDEAREVGWAFAKERVESEAARPSEFIERLAERMELVEPDEWNLLNASNDGLCREDAPR